MKESEGEDLRSVGTVYVQLAKHTDFHCSYLFCYLSNELS